MWIGTYWYGGLVVTAVGIDEIIRVQKSWAKGNWLYSATKGMGLGYYWN